MHATAARIDPEDVCEAKVVTEGGVNDFDGHGGEGPAFAADVGFGAARADVVVVCQVNIEDDLFGERPEGGGFAEGFTVAWVGGVDGSDLEAGWVQAENVFAEEVGGRVRLVTEVGVVGERESEFSVGEVVRWFDSVVEPLEELAEGEEA